MYAQCIHLALAKFTANGGKVEIQILHISLIVLQSQQVPSMRHTYIT